MSSIIAKNLTISFPVRSSGFSSLKKTVLNKAVGGRILKEESGLEITALKNVNLTLNNGDRVGLVGHNGAGKSTLLRTLAGVYYPTSGILNVDGNVTSLLDISMGMDTEATGLENIRMRAVMMGLPLNKIKDLEEKIVEFSELDNFINMPTRTYSTGMNMRLAFAVSTAIQPEILLLDEWLSVGDKHFKDKAEKRMTGLVNNTKILVLASHSADLIYNTCNRFFLLSNGAVLELSADELKKTEF